MYIICFVVALFACIIGKICGMGGGVIIKPVLDACNIMSVSSVNFLSGCTVLAMSCWSVGKSFVKKEKEIDLKTSTPLAIGAAIGGIIGKSGFNAVAAMFENPSKAGGIQAAILLVLTLATFVYTLKKDKIRSGHVSKALPCVIIGLGLGVLGSFLGIGGGPFNMAVLFLFFSMATKTAAANSLYIILISQLTSLLKTVLSGNIPSVPVWILVGMVICGILGSEVGGRVHKKINNSVNTKLLEGAMILVAFISAYNMIRLI